VVRSTRLTVVADTGAIYALIDQSDAWHARVVHWLRERPRALVLPVTILPEISYLLGSRIGPHAEAAFACALGDDEFTVEALAPEDMQRAATLVREYADLPLGFTDATVIAIAERLNAAEILTTDRPHFTVARSKQRAMLAP